MVARAQRHGVNHEDPVVIELKDYNLENVAGVVGSDDEDLARVLVDLVLGQRVLGGVTDRWFGDAVSACGPVELHTQ